MLSIYYYIICFPKPILDRLKNPRHDMLKKFFANFKIVNFKNVFAVIRKTLLRTSNQSFHLRNIQLCQVY